MRVTSTSALVWPYSSSRSGCGRDANCGASRHPCAVSRRGVSVDRNRPIVCSVAAAHLAQTQRVLVVCGYPVAREACRLQRSTGAQYCGKCVSSSMLKQNAQAACSSSMHKQHAQSFTCQLTRTVTADAPPSSAQLLGHRCIDVKSIDRRSWLVTKSWPVELAQAAGFARDRQEE
jgi:hypothetical protein